MLLAANRISPRRAAVLAYVASMLLRTVTAMDQQKQLAARNVRVVWEPLAPDREKEPAS